MHRALSFLVITLACSVDHTGLQEPEGFDGGREFDAGVRDAGPFTDGGPIDVPVRRDVPLLDSGPDIPLPTDCSVYVSLSGSDGNAGTTAAPFRTIGGAIASGASVVCVGRGNFEETVDIGAPLRLRGSYCDGFAMQDESCRTTIQAVRPWAMHIRGPARVNVELESLAIESGEPEAGGSTYGIRVLDADLVLRDVFIATNDAGDGAAGTPGATGGRGNNASSNVLTLNEGGRNCGTGGNGGVRGGGSDGADATGTSGRGGRYGSPGDLRGGDGTTGTNRSGAVGTSGAGGSGNGAISMDGLFLTANGEMGAVGPPGGGGGGGGGGYERLIAYGGGAGAGGCGGGGGGGGDGGGGSFGIIAARSTVVLEGVTARLGKGGRGGDGADGGAGGDGGSANNGGNAGGGRQGGRGGDGGQAGRGGNGGGGAGGPSVGIASDSDPVGALTLDGAAVGGDGGGGGGNPGSVGASGERLTLGVR